MKTKNHTNNPIILNEEGQRSRQKLAESIINYRNNEISRSELLNIVNDIALEDYRIHFIKAYCYNFDQRYNKLALRELKLALKCYKERHILSRKEDSRKISNSNKLELYLNESIKIPVEWPEYRDRLRISAEIYAKAFSKEGIREYKEFSEHNYRLLQYTLVSKPKSEFMEQRDKGVFAYSFRNYNLHTLHDLINQTITTCRPKLMNDPFDSLVLLWCQEENLEKFVKHKEIIPEFSQAYDYYRIRSFIANTKTKKKDKSIPRNILMWSHYADGHKGICICYRLYNKIIRGQNTTDKTRYTCLKQVNYKTSKNNKISLEKKRIDFEEAFVTKYHSWKNEKEIRIISYNPSTNEDFDPIPYSEGIEIAEIYFGCKFPPKDINGIIKILPNRENVKFYKMDIDYSNVFKLIIKPLNTL